MPDYLADQLASWMGWGKDEERTPLGRSGARGTDPAGRRKKPIDLLAGNSALRSNAALADAYAASGPGRSSRQQYGSVAPPNPEIIRRAQLASLEAPLQARDISQPPRLPIGPGPYPGERAAPGGGMAIPGGLPQGRPPTAGQPAAPGGLPQGPAPPAAGPGGGQPPPLAPSGVAPNFLGRAASSVGDFLGGVGRGVGNWMGTEVRNSGLTRGDLVFDALGNIGRGLSTTGSLSQGLALASEGQKELFKDARKQQESEEERQHRKLEMAYKQKKLEQEAAPTPFGGQETGYYTLGDDGKPQQIVPPGAGADDKATNAFQAWWSTLPSEQRTPENAQAWEEQEQARKDALSPAEQARERRAEDAARRSEESLALSRQAGERAAAAAERTAAQPTEATIRERDRALVNRVDAAVESGGWDSVRADDKRAFERVYRELATPKRTVDPLTGAVTEVQPDVTDLPVPPGYGGATAGAAPPTPGVTQPTTVIGRETITKAKEVMGLRERATGNLARVRDLLDEAGSVGRFTGDSKRRIEIAASSIITLMGELQNAGVLNPNDLERFSAELGNLTGMAAAGAEATGLDTTRAALDELWQRIDRESKTKLPKVKDEAEADKFPPGVPYLMPDGTIGSN